MIQYKLILKLWSSLVASFDKKNQTNRQKTEEIRTNHETHVKTFFFIRNLTLTKLQSFTISTFFSCKYENWLWCNHMHIAIFFWLLFKNPLRIGGQKHNNNKQQK